MKQPLIVAVGRQYGSSGRLVGAKLAERLGLDFYDKEKLMTIARSTPDYSEVKSFYEERPVNSLLYAIAMNEEPAVTSETVFRRIRALMQDHSGVLIGRCGNVIFRPDANAVSVFIHADPEIRCQRIAQLENISLKKAAVCMQEVDEERTEFHKYFTGEQWGQAEGYELCLDSGILGVDGCVEMILNYLRWRRLLDENEATGR